MRLIHMAVGHSTRRSVESDAWTVLSDEDKASFGWYLVLLTYLLTYLPTYLPTYLLTYLLKLTYLFTYLLTCLPTYLLT